MISVKVQYVTRVKATKAETEAKAAALVHWGAFSLQALTRTQIVAFGAVDTGHMLNSVGVTMMGTKRALVFVGADYSHFVNNGTRKMAARPFWDTAVGIFQPQWETAVKSL
jgi:hypothetical protein